MTNIPAIRIKNFCDEWVLYNIDKKVDFYNGLTYTPSDVVKQDGTLVLRSSNVQGSEIVSADNVYVNSDVVNTDNVRVGDIVVVVRNGSKALLGKHAEVKTEMPNTVIGAFMTGIRTQNPPFVNALLSTPAFNEELRKNMGATINQITGGMFKSMEFYFPEDEEQKKIGRLFDGLDDVITLYQKKLSKLVLAKKSMLLKMFPQNGATVPEIRFDGFKDDWDKYKFGQLFEKNDALNDIGLGIEKTITVASMKYNPEGNGSAEASIPKYKLLRYGDIAFEGNRRKNHPYGKLVINDIGDGIMSARFRTLKPIVKPCVKFWKHYLSITEIFQSILLRSTKRGTLMNELVLEDLMEEIVYLPSEKEQEKIGDFFDNLDNLIALQEAKIEKLKKAKQALLNKMFV